MDKRGSQLVLDVGNEGLGVVEGLGGAFDVGGWGVAVHVNFACRGFEEEWVGDQVER